MSTFRRIISAAAILFGTAALSVGAVAGSALAAPANAASVVSAACTTPVVTLGANGLTGSTISWPVMANVPNTATVMLDGVTLPVTPGTSKTFTGLAANSYHEVSVTRNCSTGATATTSATTRFDFVTRNGNLPSYPKCAAPAGALTVGAVTSTSITYVWSPITSVGAKYQLFFRPLGSTVMQRPVVTETTQTFTGLTPNTKYSFDMYNACSTGWGLNSQVAPTVTTLP